MHLAGCMLYWAEGTKSMSQVEFVNSDADMISLFARFLRECYGVTDDMLRVSCRTYPDHAPRKIEDYWLGVLNLPRAALTQTYVNSISSSSKGKREGRLEHGMVSLRVSDVQVVQSIYGALAHYLGREPDFLKKIY